MADTIFAPLPPEITAQILDNLSATSKTSLLTLRLIDRPTCSLVTPIAFRSLVLGASDGSPQAFTQIARSENVCKFVRELTCDTWIGTLEQDASQTSKARIDFVAVLPLVRYFTNLKSLRLRFGSECPHGDNFLARQTRHFHLNVLHAIFTSLAGDWSGEEQKALRDGLGKRRVKPAYLPEWDERYEAGRSTGPIPLERLTIYNLADYNYKWAAESEPLQKMLALGSLVDLRLCMTSQEPDMYRGYFDGEWDIHRTFETLPSTWLSLPAVQNLSILSLSSRQYWGWYPKFDFRAAGGGRGFPNLKVLALRNFVFSHEWQIDWFASLELEELLLERCPIMFAIDYQILLDDGRTVVGQDEDGNDIKVSNQDYPAYRKMGCLPGSTSACRNIPLRWHNMFNQWQQSMKTLRRFKVNFGELYDAHEHKSRTSSSQAHHNEHRDFQSGICPAPSKKETHYRMDDDEKSPLRYVYFESDDWYENGKVPEAYGAKLEEGLEEVDKATLVQFLETIRQRSFPRLSP